MRRISFAALILTLLYLTNASGQAVSVGIAPAVYHTPAQVPSALASKFLALGNRLQKPGNERITLTGVLTDSTGSSQVQIVLELGGKLSITWLGKGAQKVVFNGTNASGASAVAIGNDLLEALSDDLPETVMSQVATGTGSRMLGQKFPNPGGGFCDYFDVPTLGRAVKKQAPVTKRYCFDSQVGLLRSVRYLGSTNQLTMTQFGNWATISGQAVAGSIVRQVGGVQVFSFQAQNAVVSGATTDSTFLP